MSHHTPPHTTTHHHITTTTPHTPHNTPRTEPTPDSIRENSPGLDTARIDRLIALSSFSVWWCMAVPSLCSDFLFNSVCARDLSLLNSVKYDFSLISSWTDFVCPKCPFSASWQVNSFSILRIIYSMRLQFSIFSIICVRSCSFFLNYFAHAGTVFFRN